MWEENKSSWDGIVRVYSYKGCQTCLVQAKCTCVCDQYKRTIKRKYKINVDCEIPLDKAEEQVAKLMVMDDEVFPPMTIKGIDAINAFYLETTVSLEQE